eukprot:4365523-Alexandrium_andersonii.AAC.1
MRKQFRAVSNSCLPSSPVGRPPLLPQQTPQHAHRGSGGAVALGRGAQESARKRSRLLAAVRGTA